MREIMGMLQSIDAELGAVLRRVVDLRIHRALGFDSFVAYVRERLGISPAKARALVSSTTARASPRRSAKRSVRARSPG